jgi:DNA-binding transcriptional ArsR family regulator
VNDAERLDRSFVAFAHPARRAIVARLARGSATVGEATRGLALSKPAISKHLQVLERAGLVSRRVEGRRHRLTLEAAAIEEAARWIEGQARPWRTKLDAVERFLAEDPAAEIGVP